MDHTLRAVTSPNHNASWGMYMITAVVIVALIIAYIYKKRNYNNNYNNHDDTTRKRGYDKYYVRSDSEARVSIESFHDLGPYIQSMPQIYDQQQYNNIQNVNQVKDVSQRKKDQQANKPIVPIQVPGQDQDEVYQLGVLLNMFLNNTDRWDALVAIGDIYARGAFPRWQPNTLLAMRCYRLASMCPDGDIAGTAQVKAIDLRDHPLIALDRQGADLPTQPGEAVCKLALERVRMLPQDAFQKPISKFKRQDSPVAQTRPTHAQNQNQNQTAQHDAPGVMPRPPVAARAYVNDKQNVHDHGVISGLKRTASRLASRVNFDLKMPLSMDQAKRIKEKAIDAVLTDNTMSSDEKMHAMEMISALISKQENSTIGTTEVHALALAYETINRIEDVQLRANLTESLNKQLASGVEKGHVVCSTGRLARILGTFDGVEDLQGNDRIRPIWAVREEIASLAAKIRDNILNTLDSSEVDAYNRGQRPRIEETMKQEFRKQVISLYVDGLGMLSAIIDPIISQYADAF